MKIWLLAIRPKTLAASLSPILIGTAMALKTGFFDLLTFLFTLLTGLGIQIATNLANDYFDYKKGADTSARLGPIRVTQAKLVSESGMIKMLFFTFLTTLTSGSFLIWKGGAIFSLLIAAALLFALIYTAGPFPIAYLGLGEVFVLVFFGPVAVAATYFLQVGQFHVQPVIAGLAPGLLSSAILMVNNLRDIDEDQKAHKKTLAVRFGLRFGKNLYLFFLVLAPLLPLTLYHRHPLILLASLTLLPSLFLIREVFNVQDPRLYNPLLGKTAKLLMVYTLIFCFSWMV